MNMYRHLDFNEYILAIVSFFFSGMPKVVQQALVHQSLARKTFKDAYVDISVLKWLMLSTLLSAKVFLCIEDSVENCSSLKCPYHTSFICGLSAFDTRTFPSSLKILFFFFFYTSLPCGFRRFEGDASTEKRNCFQKREGGISCEVELGPLRSCGSR